MSVPDRIEKSVVLPAPLARAWRAVSEAREFGAWFGVAFDGPFAEGARATGVIRPTTVDAEVGRLQAPHAGKAFEFTVERLEAPRRFAFRWHPFAVDPGVDYSKEATTLVVFELAEAPGGTRLTISESGFDRLPAGRRAEAFAANDGGWDHQARLVEQYLRTPGRPAEGMAVTAPVPARRAFSVAIFCRHGDAVLLIRHKRLGTWLPVGGELEPGETPLEAAERELREETGLVGRFPGGLGVDGTPPGLIGYEEHQAGSKGLHLNFAFVAWVATREVQGCDEFDDWRWVEAKDLDAMECPRNVKELARLALAAPALR